MELIKTDQLSKVQKQQILKIWNNEYPARLNYNSLEEFEDYLSKLTDQKHLLIVDKDQNVFGWYFHFMRDDERWFAIILDSKIQNQGYGTMLLNEGKTLSSELNGWVMDQNDLKKNGEVYSSPLPFYLKNGFELLADIRLEIDKMSAVKIRWTQP
ncbi:MAG TPA: GNAT family N-acetyltransferase, partial [Roseivirga sp.]